MESVKKATKHWAVIASFTYSSDVVREALVPLTSLDLKTGFSRGLFTDSSLNPVNYRGVAVLFRRGLRCAKSTVEPSTGYFWGDRLKLPIFL